jgi:hypothetical protein
MSIPNTTYRVLVEKLGDSNPSQFIGNEGELFYDPNSPDLKLSNGTTPGGVAISGTGGGADTGNITFSGETIIGDTNDEFQLGVIQLTPSLDDPDSGQLFVTNGQYVNVYPTIADDAPHIHITAGTLSTTSNYYDSNNNYYKGDLFIGDDSNYYCVRGNGLIRIYSSTYNSEINFDNNGISGRNRLSLYSNGNELSIYNQGLDFDRDFAISQCEVSYIGSASTQRIYQSKMYNEQIGSMKLLVQCQGGNNNCQLSELLVVRPYDGTTVFITESSRVTGIGTSAHVAFTASYNTDEQYIEVFADTTIDPLNDQWSFRVVPIEIRQHQD